MNRALNLKNWSDGGNNYILKGNPKNKWAGFQDSVISELKHRYGNKFNIVIYTDPEIEMDYYCIPFSTLEHLFIDKHKTSGKYPNRWTAIVLNHRFLMHSNSELSVDISKYYAMDITPQPSIMVDDDFYIENAKSEISVRIGQSKFRKSVLKNFDGECALSGIKESSLLVASHIVPWAHNKHLRGDISNGICLYIEYDMLFDKGFLSFSDNLDVILTPLYDTLSDSLKTKLGRLYGLKLRNPKTKKIKIDYLKYHRENILKK